MDRRTVEKKAREAGPWTDDDAEAIRSLRELSRRTGLTDAERNALRVLRQREITEAVRLRRKVATTREP